MRHDDTPAEKKAWVLLKDRRTLGLKFRRQVPIDRYIVDFYCHEIRVIIELDGGVHDRPEQVKWDVERNIRLEELGYKILHITNEVIMKDPENLTEMIRALYPSPAAARHPLPLGERYRVPAGVLVPARCRHLRPVRRKHSDLHPHGVRRRRHQ
jgi:uroporphyrinogen-III synthase